MTNQEIINAVEEWVDEHEAYVDNYEIDEQMFMVNAHSIIIFIKKLLHE